MKKNCFNFLSFLYRCFVNDVDFQGNVNTDPVNHQKVIREMKDTFHSGHGF